MRLSIRWQLVLVICTVLFGTLLISSAVIEHIVAQDYEQKIRQTNGTMADSLSIDISQFMDNAMIMGSTLADYPDIMQAQPGQQQAELRRMVAKYPYFQLMAVTDLAGNQIARSSGVPGNRANRPWFRKFMFAHKPIISEAYYSSTTETPVITMVTGVYDNHQQLTGMIMADIELRRIQKMVEQYDMGDGQYAFLLDSGGNLIAHPDLSKVNQLTNYSTGMQQILVRDEAGKPVSLPDGNLQMASRDYPQTESFQEIVRKTMAGESGVREFQDVDGERYICAYVPVHFSGMTDSWSLLVVQKYSMAMAFMDTVTQKILLIVGLVLLLAAGIVVLFSRRFTYPIRELVKAAENVEKGDFSARVAVHSQDEIGQLSRIFNRMAASLQEHQLRQTESERKIVHMAYHDVLTGLPNRTRFTAYLTRQLEVACRKNCLGAVIFIDVDGFKLINDTFGHSVGDQLLIQVSHHLQQSVDKDAFVCRLGGDEFIIVLPQVESREAVAGIADRMMDHLGGEYVVGEYRMHLSGSVGIAVFPEDGDNADDLLKKADSAMYAAKNAGRSCWRFYEPAMLAEACERMFLTEELRRAMRENELFLVYQPQFTVDGSRLVGFEALVRWNNPVRGIISPMRFIPLAEQSGLILPMGCWIMERACKFIARLEKCNRASRVAVNVSSLQLADEGFVEFVRQCIEKSGIQASHLSIEITESVFIKSMADSVNKLQRLRALGIGIALDDFGTGYSSLTYLRTLPVGTIKLDKSFIDRILQNHADLQLLGCIIEMAHTLGMPTIAEGVEQQAQLEQLCAFQCDYVQGYIFSKPLAEEAALDLLEKYFCTKE